MKLVLFLVVLLLPSLATASSPSTDPRHELLISIIKKYETLHHNSGSLIGYGHLIQPDEPFYPSQELSEAEADALLRIDIAKLYDMLSRYGDAKYLLAALSYNVGIAKVIGGAGHPKSQFLCQLESGNRNLREYYIKFCHYKGLPHKGLMLRRLVEYALLWEKQ